MVKRLFYCLSLAVLVSLVCLDALAQGLGFYGMSNKIDERTSYTVFGNKTICFKDSFQMEFELSPEMPSDFGYFFRVKDAGESHKIWNLSYDSRADSIVIRLNEEGRHSLIRAVIPSEDIKPLHWTRVKLVMDFSHKNVSLEVAGKFFGNGGVDYPASIDAQVVFGRSDHIIDVPSFSIRDLKISDGGDRSLYFPLNQRQGEKVYDDSHKVCGRVVNPNWLINKAIDWSPLCSFSFDDIAGAAYNHSRKEFYYFTREEILIYSLMSSQYRVERFKSELPVVMKLGNNFVSEDGSKLYCYELYNEDVPEGSPSVAALDLDSMEWKVCCRQQLGMPMHHHTGFFNPNNGQYTIFGGFGNMLYNGAFHSFDADLRRWTPIWEESLGDPIFPRYFTSSGTDGTYIYIYGGMGNECGEQVVGRRYFYDLHRLDPAKGTNTLLWELDWDSSDMVPVRSLVVDGDSFYTLCYPEYISQSQLHLFKFNISDGSHTGIGNAIPIVSDKMRTNANLCLDRELGRFFAMVQEFDDDIKSTLKIYELAYPPMTEAAGPKSKTALWIVVGVLMVLVISLLVLLRRKNRATSSSSGHLSKEKAFKYRNAPNQIRLFGELTINDRNGEDVTSVFTNQQIIILCLLVRRHENGISTKRLSSILWPDKEEDKVKNSRGVAINNLRKSLDLLSGATIEYRGGRYYLELSEDCRCDYWDLQSYLEGRDSDVVKALDIISQGRFLKSVDDVLFDDFKDQVDGSVIALLQRELSKNLKVKNYPYVEQICQMMMVIDPLDEEALKAMVRVLRKQKRVEEAIVLYSNYCSEYKKLNDEDYSTPFKNL